jgi:hypothetical protein
MQRFFPRSSWIFGRATIHFCFCRQVDCQEYSEFRKSALLALSAPVIGKNGQLGIFRNSEYRQKSYANDFVDSLNNAAPAIVASASCMVEYPAAVIHIALCKLLGAPCILVLGY